MDTFFVGHGAPTISIDERIPARHFLKSWKAKVLPEIPRAILMVSGHWDTAEPTVNASMAPVRPSTTSMASRSPCTSYYERERVKVDSGSKNLKAIKLKYPAPGAPELAKKVKELLKNAGIGRVKEDKSRGLDHGAWIPLMLMYPEANIPVCQLSIQCSKDGTYHYNMGKALAPLRDEGILIIGSGNVTHNLRKITFEDGPVPSWALDFDNWLLESLLGGRHEEVNHFQEKAPAAKIAQPWPDHFYPLHVALGAAGENAKAELIHNSWGNSSISYSSYRFKTE